MPDARSRSAAAAAGRAAARVSETGAGSWPTSSASSAWKAAASKPGRRAPGGEAEHHVGEERRVLLPEREQQEQQRLRSSGVDLARHPQVEEVDLLVRTTSGCPGAGRRGRTVGRAPAGSRPRAAGGPPRGARVTCGRLADRDALHLLHHEQPAGRQLGVHTGTSSRSNGASTPRIRSMFAASCRKSSSRRSEVERCSMIAGTSTSCRNAGRSPALAANCSSSPRSCRSRVRRSAAAP